MHTQTTHARQLSYRHHRILVPDPLEPWSLEEVEQVLWPDTPDHRPPPSQEDGWSSWRQC
jgi:hypothetical protein